MDRAFLYGLGLEKRDVDSVLDRAGADIMAVKKRLAAKEAELAELRGALLVANAALAAWQRERIGAAIGRRTAHRRRRFLPESGTREPPATPAKAPGAPRRTERY